MIYALPKYLSNEARDLISSLLTWNADQRLTIYQVRDHPFFSAVFGLNGSIMRLSPISRQEITYAEYSEQMVSPVKAQAISNNSRSKPRRKTFDNKVIPISTSNLGLILPFKHPLQDGMLEILKDGRIILKVRSKCLEVSTDGNSVKYEGHEMRINSMTKHCTKLYKYLENVLEAIRSKTPKVTVKVGNSVCMLMWNSPPSNFEVDFNNGSKLVMKVGSDNVRILTSDREFEVSIMQDYDYLDLNLKEIIDIAMSGLKLCFEKEKKDYA